MVERKEEVKEKAYFSVKEWLKNQSLIIILLIIGFLCIIIAQYMGAQSPWFVIFLTIGVTCIVSLTMVIVEYILRSENIKLTESFFASLEKRSEEMIDNLKVRLEEKISVIEEKMDRSDSKLELSGKLNGLGIIDIFPDRWDHASEYHEKIRKHLSEYAEQIKRGEITKEEICIMGIALRHFFQNETYKEELATLNELGIKFKVLLLDPESEAALERSEIESPEVYEPNYLKGFTDEEKKIYDLFVDTAMFKDLYDTHEYIVERSPSWIINFDIKYYKNDPSYYLIKLPDKLIIESYNYGSVKECDILPINPVIPNPFIGGRIPIFVYGPECITYRLISNHFKQIWRRSAATPKDKTDYFETKRIKRFDQSTKRKKM